MLRNMLEMDIPWENTNYMWTSPCGAYHMYDLKSQWDFGMEGYFLAHCIGTKDADRFLKDHRVLSLRDRIGIPHCTVLLQRNHSWSPYGRSADLFTKSGMTLDGGDVYFVLEVRGREDKIARWEYYSMIRKWYAANNGKLNPNINYAKLKKAITKHGDHDLKYHYGYLLDESRNIFNWAYHNVEAREKFAQLGLSK